VLRFADELFEAWLVDRDIALVQHLDLPIVDVHADNLVAALSKTSAVTRPTYPVPITEIFILPSVRTG